MSPRSLKKKTVAGVEVWMRDPADARLWRGCAYYAQVTSVQPLPAVPELLDVPMWRVELCEFQLLHDIDNEFARPELDAGSVFVLEQSTARSLIGVLLAADELPSAKAEFFAELLRVPDAPLWWFQRAVVRLRLCHQVSTNRNRAKLANKFVRNAIVDADRAVLQFKTRSVAALPHVPVSRAGGRAASNDF